MDKIEFTAAELRVAAALSVAAPDSEIRVLDQSAHTAQMAAEALGVAVGQIVKSLCFAGQESGRAFLILASGANRVHERRTGRLIGEKLVRADADLVKSATGFSIGGVSPFGHPAPMAIYLDEDLMQYGDVWAAAGNPRSVFCITPQLLLAATGATLIKIT